MPPSRTGPTWRRPRGLVGQPGALNPVRLIFLDETWIATNMMRRYGRSPRGERLVGAVPYGHWKTTTFVVGPRCDGLTASFVIDGPINGEWFRAYVEKVLAPTLRPGDIVILDNLGAHKVAGVRAAGPSRRAAPGCSTCRPIRQTSTRSSSSSPSSRRSCARPPPELSRPSGQPSPPCAPPSAPMNAQITSPPQVIDAHRESALVYRFLCIPARRPTRTVAGSRRGLSGPCSAADIKLARPARARLPAGMVRRQLAARARLDQQWLGSSRRFAYRRVPCRSPGIRRIRSHSDLDGRRPE